MEVRNKIAKKVKKRYSKSLEEINYREPKTQSTAKTIWVCWLQGEQPAPKLVKKCLSSIRKHSNYDDMIFITKNNYANFTNIPAYIVDKWNNGNISNAHFSDILRTAILAENGGIWIDATVYLLDKIPDYLKNSKLFLFNYEDNDSSFKYNNWFIIAQKNNPVMLTMRDLLYIYWKKEKKAYDYFIWQLLFSIVIKKYDYDKNIFYIPNSLGHMIHKKCNEDFNQSYMNVIKKICPIQKLSYKIDSSNPNSFLNHIINEQ